MRSDIDVPIYGMVIVPDQRLIYPLYDETELSIAKIDQRLPYIGNPFNLATYEHHGDQPFLAIVSRNPRYDIQVPRTEPLPGFQFIATGSDRDIIDFGFNPDRLPLPDDPRPTYYHCSRFCPTIVTSYDQYHCQLEPHPLPSGLTVEWMYKHVQFLDLIPPTHPMAQKRPVPGYQGDFIAAGDNIVPAAFLGMGNAVETFH